MREFGPVTRRKAEVMRNDRRYGIDLTGRFPSHVVSADEDELPSVNPGVSMRRCENWDIDNIGIRNRTRIDIPISRFNLIMTIAGNRRELACWFDRYHPV